MRFNQIAQINRLRPTEVTRVLADLIDAVLLIPKMVPGPGKRVFAEYHLTKAGTSHLKAFDVYAESLRGQARLVGESTLRELDSLYG